MSKKAILLKTNKRIFTAQDLAVLWNQPDQNRLKESIKYYLERKILRTLMRGIYLFGKQGYDPFELAQKIIPKSYISFYTALKKHGLVFQYYKTIHCIALKTKHYNIKGQEFFYHKINPDILFNDIGIMKEKNYNIAGPERAICDSLYLEPSLGFDNLKQINFKLLLEISKIYNNKNLERRVFELRQKYDLELHEPVETEGDYFEDLLIREENKKRKNA